MNYRSLFLLVVGLLITGLALSGTIPNHSLAQDTPAGPPAKVEGLQARQSDDQVTLTWVPNTENDLHHYLVVYDTAPLSSFEGVTQIIINQSYTTHTLRLPVGQTYYFGVLAVDTSGNHLSTDYSQTQVTIEAVPALLSATLGPFNDPNGQPLTGARISLAHNATEYTRKSDTDGYARFESLPSALLGQTVYGKIETSEYKTVSFTLNLPTDIEDYDTPLAVSHSLLTEKSETETEAAMPIWYLIVLAAVPAAAVGVIAFVIHKRSLTHLSTTAPSPVTGAATTAAVAAAAVTVDEEPTEPTPEPEPEPEPEPKPAPPAAASTATTAATTTPPAATRTTPTHAKPGQDRKDVKIVGGGEEGFKIMDIFLIYFDGLLMKHISHPDKLGDLVDEDLFGGMLTAIKNFIEDSFQQGGGLKTLQYGKLNIFIERGPQMFLAVVFSGDGPNQLRNKMRYLLIDIYDNYKRQVKHWDGTEESIEGIAEFLARLFAIEEDVRAAEAASAAAAVPAPAAAPKIDAILSITKREQEYEVGLAAQEKYLYASATSEKFKVSDPKRSKLIAATNTMAMFSQGKLASQPAGRDQDVNAFLRSLGSNIYSAFVPSTIQSKLATTEKYFVIETNDNAIPWELIYDGESFLCLSRPMSRFLKLKDPPRRNAYSPGAKPRFLFIIDPTGELPTGAEETENIAFTLDSDIEGTVMVGAEATRAAVLDALRSGTFDVIHYTGKAMVDPADATATALVLAGGELVGATEINTELAGRPLFVMNLTFVHTESASQTARSRLYYGAEVWGLASGCIAGGAMGYIGTSWEIPDDSQSLVATALYERLLASDPLGEALRIARETLHTARDDDVSWASFLMYGYPSSVLLEPDQ